jgi:hypothetical protein
MEPVGGEGTGVSRGDCGGVEAPAVGPSEGVGEGGGASEAPWKGVAASWLCSAADAVARRVGSSEAEGESRAGGKAARGAGSRGAGAGPAGAAVALVAVEAEGAVVRLGVEAPLRARAGSSARQGCEGVQLGGAAECAEGVPGTSSCAV